MTILLGVEYSICSRSEVISSRFLPLWRLRLQLLMGFTLKVSPSTDWITALKYYKSNEKNCQNFEHYFLNPG